MTGEAMDTVEPPREEPRPDPRSTRPTGWRRWVTRRHIIQVVLLLGVAYVAVPFIREAASVGDSLRAANWWWYLVAAGAVFGGYVCAFTALIACAGIRAPLWEGIKLQLAASFTGTATPASVGSLAIAGRYLMKRGSPGAIATAAVGLQSVVTFLVHIILLGLFVVVGGRSVNLNISAPSGNLITVVLAIALVAVGIVLGVPRLREGAQHLWERRGRAVVENVAGLFRTPHRLLAAILGAAGGTLSLAIALWAVLNAVGGGNHFMIAVFTTMVGATLATAAPTPGGIGAVEAALIGGLTAFGVEAGDALVAAMGYRIVSTWIPVGLGWFAYRNLERSGAI